MANLLTDTDYDLLQPGTTLTTAPPAVEKQPRGAILGYDPGNSVLAIATAGRPYLVICGLAAYGIDNTGSTVTSQTADPGTYPMAQDGSITDAQLYQECFALDSQTWTATDQGGTLPGGAQIVGVPSTSIVWVRMSPIPGRSAAAPPSTVTARGVVSTNVTSLAAFTVATGLTYAAGQTVLLANQTTAAQCGPYLVGPVVAGVAALRRHHAWPTGSAWPEGATVNVIEGDGTRYALSTWRSTATGSKIVGTDDPLFYPATYRQTVTLVSGTYTIGVGGGSEPLFLLAGATIELTSNTHAGTIGTSRIEAPSASRTAGKAGTALFVINSLIDNGGVGTSDTSTVDVLVTNIG